MGIFNWMKRSANRDDFRVDVLPPPRPVYDVQRQAISIASVYRSVSILSTAVSQMAGGVYKKDVLIDKPTWLYNPDPDMTGNGFTEVTVSSLALYGNAYWRVYRNGRNEPIALKVLNPSEVEVSERNGKPVYLYANRELDATEIKHLQLLRVPGQAKGVGPIQAARYTLEGQLALQNFQNTWFDATIPQAYLKSDQVLNKEIADMYEARWQEKLNNSRTPVLGSGLELKSMLMNPKDAMFIDVAGYNVSEIARLFGIPNHYLGSGIEGSSLTYTTTVDLDIQFLRYTLTQYVTEIEAAVSSLLPRGTYYKFETSSLLRTNDKMRYEAYQIAVATGWLTNEEVRDIEGLPELPVLNEELKLSNEEGQ